MGRDRLELGAAHRAGTAGAAAARGRRGRLQPAAAEAVCAEDGLDVLGLLARLVDRSLVVAADGPDGPRYRLPESVAAYGLQRLDQAGESGRLRVRHRRYYTDLAERAAPRLRRRTSGAG